MEAIERREIRIKSKEMIAYRYRQGGKHTLVLLHGNMASSQQYDYFMENVDKAFTLYALDMRGFGNSSYFTRIDSLDTFAEDLKEFADAIGLKTFTVVGWSLGGNVAMRFAIEYPEHVEKLVLLAPPSVKGMPVRKRTLFGLCPSRRFLTTREGMEKHVAKVENWKLLHRRRRLKAMLNRTRYNNQKPLKARYDNYLNELMMQRNLADVKLALARFNISEEHNGVVSGTGEASQIDAPTLIIHGNKDRAVPLAAAHENKRAIGDNAEVHVVKNGDHALMMGSLGELMNVVETFVL